MKEQLANVFKKLEASFDTSTKGYSSRKLSAFIIMICVVAAHVKWMAMGNFTQLEMVLTIDYTFIAALLGMTTYESIKKKSNESPTDNS